MGKLDHQFWKPDPSDGYVAPKNEELYKKTVKPKKKNKSKPSSNAIREKLTRRFGINKYASNTAICFCIHKETGAEMPDTENATYAMMRKYLKGELSTIIKTPKDKDDGDFYNSKKWQEVRYIALSLSNGRCSLCGAAATDGVEIHVDHIKPRSKYPELQFDLNNLQILCVDCNIGKSNYDDRDWRLLMK